MPLNPEIVRHQMDALIERWKALGASDEEIAAALVCGAVIMCRKDEPKTPGVSKRLGTLLAMVGDAWTHTS